MLIKNTNTGLIFDVNEEHYSRLIKQDHYVKAIVRNTRKKQPPKKQKKSE